MGLELYQRGKVDRSLNSLQKPVIRPRLERSFSGKRHCQKKIHPNFDHLAGIPIDDHLGLYLAQVTRIPLLTGIEEKQLAESKKRGSKAQRVLEQGLRRIPAAKRNRLVGIKLEGEAARRKLILANLRLVIDIAKRTRNLCYRQVSLLNLIQEGSIGLIEGIDKFDPEYGYKLSTYVTWWIRSRINFSISQGFKHDMGISYRTHKRNKVITRLINEVFDEGLTYAQIVQEIKRYVKAQLQEDLTKNQKRFLASIARINEKELAKILHSTSAPVSFDDFEWVDVDSRSIFGTNDEKEEKPENPFIGIPEEVLIEILRSSGLTTPEMDVVLLRYYSNGNSDEDGLMSYEKIAQTLGKDEHTWRTYHYMAIKKLKKRFSSQTELEEYTRSILQSVSAGKSGIVFKN